VAKLPSFVLTVPAQSAGRYKDVDWDGVLSEYRGAVKDRKNGRADGASTSGGTFPLGKGSRIAPGYRVIAHLSRGNLTDVYDVWSEERACRCVAKLLRPECRTQQQAAHLVREGQRLQRFSHPHIVRAYEVVEAPEPIVVLETLTSETLEHLIGRRPRRLSLHDIGVLGIHLCSAAHYLHGQGLLHLDLNPSNIVADCGRAKVLDLSVAQPPGPCPADVGTRRYMAPEQTRGGRLGFAADVWGIGAVLYEAATGRFEQRGGTVHPVGAYRRLPTAFERLVTRCLDADPASRPSVLELAEALSALVGDEPDRPSVTP
jgi:eukaryotic-like serine/threonine-protein kinase